VAKLKPVTTRRDLLRAAVDEGYEAPAWHGPNLTGALGGVTAAQAAWRPAPGRHSIWDVTVHAAYWKYRVRRRLGSTDPFPLKGSDWFTMPEPLTAEAWERARALLDREHRLLIAAIDRLRDADLDARLATIRQTALQNVRGIAFHDVYHAGQIQLLKRLQGV
jgi:hypothetical protein